MSRESEQIAVYCLQPIERCFSAKRGAGGFNGIGAVHAYERILPAVLTYVDCPSEQQLEQMKTFLCKKYHVKEVEWQLEQDDKLLGGFILHVKDYEYDWSLRGRMNQLRLIWR